MGPTQPHPKWETISQLLPDAPEERRIRRILGFHARIQRGTVGMLVLAYEAGRELRPLHEKRRKDRDWVKFAAANLRGIDRRTLNNYLALDAAFNSLEEVRALKPNLTRAYELARRILRAGKPERESATSFKDPTARAVRGLRRAVELVRGLDRLAWLSHRDGLAQCRQALQDTLDYLNAIDQTGADRNALRIAAG